MAKALVENVVDIHKSPAVVFDYASHHMHEPEIEPGNAKRSYKSILEGAQ